MNVSDKSDATFTGVLCCNLDYWWHELCFTRFLVTTNLLFVHREHLNRRIGASAPQIKFMLTDLAEKKTQTLMDNLQHELETMVDDEPTDGEQISSQLLFDRFASIMK